VKGRPQGDLCSLDVEDTMLSRKTGGSLLAALLALGLSASQASAEDADDRRQRDAIERARVSPKEAAEIALKEIPDGRIVDVDIETVRGTVIYAIEIEKERRLTTVFVDPESGNVLRVKSERDDDNDDDDDDDDDEYDERRRSRR
jgi:uncharacterized membrane protein YkoI